MITASKNAPILSLSSLFDSDIKPKTLHSLFELADDIQGPGNDNTDTAILTANQRQARYLRELFATNSEPKPNLTISSYDSWLTSQWSSIQDIFIELPYRHLLSPLQKNFIWEHIVQGREDLPVLIDKETISKNLQEAHTILLDFLIPKNELENTNDKEAQFLLNCLEQYETALEQSNSISQEFLASKLCEIYEQHTLEPSFQFYLYGFAEITPRMTHVFKTLGRTTFSLDTTSNEGLTNDTDKNDPRQEDSKPLRLHDSATPSEGSSRETSIKDTPSSLVKPINAHQVHCFHSTNEELKSANLWAKNYLDKHPNDKLAIIAPNLTSIKSELETELLKTFDTQYFFSNEHFIVNNYFDISAAEPLSDIPVIDTIFLLLELRKSRLDKTTCRKICRSIFWGQSTLNQTETQMSARGTSRFKMLEWIKTYSSPYIPTSLFNKMWHVFDLEQLKTNMSIEAKDVTERSEAISEHQNPSCFDQSDLFANSLDSQNNQAKTSKSLVEDRACASYLLGKFREQLRSKKSYATHTFTHWVDYLTDCLKCIGWPGKRTPSTYEYQQLQRFFDLLEEIKALDICVERFKHKDIKKSNFTGFMQELKRACHNTSFHMQTTEARFSVLGLMESSALSFDACWVLNASDKVLPSAPNPNPFIPIYLQTRYSTPRSSHQRELNYARKFIHDLGNFCNELHFSYCDTNEEGQQSLSPLITQKTIENDHITLQMKQENYMNPIEDYCSQGIKFTDFELVDTGLAPKINEGEIIPGGSGHISLHGVNPLYAFLSYRLGAGAHQNAESIGFTSLERGNIIHEILQKIYLKTNSQEKLRAWSILENFDEDLTEIIERVLSKQQTSTSKHIPISLVQAEKKYLLTKILEFIQKELERQAFITIETESNKVINVCERKIKLRIDRVDQAISDVKEDHISLAIFDYKTGNISLSGLRKSPVTDAQLPLYTLANFSEHKEFTDQDIHIDTVAYTQISYNNVGYMAMGLSSDKNTEATVKYKPIEIPKTKKVNDSRAKTEGVDCWPDLLKWWKGQIETSVTEISSGFCYFEIRDKVKSKFYESLLTIVRDEELGFRSHIDQEED